MASVMSTILISVEYHIWYHITVLPYCTHITHTSLEIFKLNIIQIKMLKQQNKVEITYPKLFDESAEIT